jgi:hypothetical protein
MNWEDPVRSSSTVSAHVLISGRQIRVLGFRNQAYRS